MDEQFKFQVGDSVRVRLAFPPGHVRTPQYIRGKTGVISSRHGRFRNPEQLAYGQDGLPEIPLYKVEFPLSAISSTARPRDKLCVDIFEHWLEPTSSQSAG